MGSLTVPGAELHYDVVGKGPLLVLVPGAKGEGGVFQSLMEQIKNRYSVVTYDRRGFSRSRLEKPLDGDHIDPDDLNRLSVDAADVRRLIDHLGDEPAIVFGNSSGAIVALRVLIDHADSVRTVIAHEPPLVRLLPDGDKWIAFFLHVYHVYIESGVPAAMKVFIEGAFGGAEGAAMLQNGMAAGNNPYALPNARFWMEHELRQYPKAALNIDALAKHTDRLILACGRDSRGKVAYMPNEVLAAKLGVKMVELPGGHIGFIQDPAEFSRELVAALKGEQEC